VIGGVPCSGVGWEGVRHHDRSNEVIEVGLEVALRLQLLEGSEADPQGFALLRNLLDEACDDLVAKGASCVHERWHQPEDAVDLSIDECLQVCGNGSLGHVNLLVNEQKQYNSIYCFCQ
jgi:hypothetical protein